MLSKQISLIEKLIIIKLFKKILMKIILINLPIMEDKLRIN